jgi:hypothetical protein
MLSDEGQRRRKDGKSKPNDLEFGLVCIARILSLLTIRMLSDEGQRRRKDGKSKPNDLEFGIVCIARYFLCQPFESFLSS